MATAQEYVNGALRLIGQLAEGETPSASTSVDALEALNGMIDSWNTERLSVFTTNVDDYTWTANQASRTLGPSGADLTGPRPVLVDDSTFFVSGNLSYPLNILNRAEYSAIALKSSTSTFPQCLFAEMSVPNVTLYLWPVPTTAIELHLVSVTKLEEPATLGTSIVVPDGYRRAFRFNLAQEIAAEFGIDPPPTVVAIARKSKLNIKRINNPEDAMSMPYALVGRRRSNFNIYSGQPM